MNKIRWRILGAICLLLSLIPLIIAGTVWVSASQPATSAAVPMQAIQAAVGLLLDDVQTDNGFRPNPNGYSFPNYGEVNLADLTVEDLRPIFGDSAVCSSKPSGVCLYNPVAVQWSDDWNQAMGGGHCYGMAVTSSRFFAGVDQPSSLQANAATTYDLQLANARRNIASYFVRQGANPAAAYVWHSLNTTPNQVLEQIRNSFDSPVDSLTIISLGPGAGHAITPYSVNDRGNGIVWVMVYDNNHPNDANRHIEFNMTSNTWSYDLGWITWSGDAVSHNIGVVPYSLNNAVMDCPWCSAQTNSNFMQLWAISDAKMLVTDAAGRRFGMAGSDFVSEIPNAYQTVLITGLPGPSPAIYNIPISGTQTLLLNSGVITQPTLMTLSQFGPDYAMTIDGIKLNPAKQDQVQIAADGKYVAYQASEQKAVTLTLALANIPSLSAAGQTVTATVESYSFALGGVDIGSNQIVAASVDSAHGTLTFNNAKANEGVYSLEIERTDNQGQRVFRANGIMIGSSDTQVINYGLWDNTNDNLAPMTLQVDHGSNGTVDNTIQLQNQAGKTYLPLITR
ncbi:MAG: hypothetical protein U0350_31840 [Caldilineaceae bacterium]